MSVINKILSKSDAKKPTAILPVGAILQKPKIPQPPATQIHEAKIPTKKIPLAKNHPANPLPKNPNSNFFSPCQKCQSPIFWFSVGSTIPRCIDCEFPAAPQLIKKICAVEKNQKGEYQSRLVHDLPSFGIRPATENQITTLDADPSSELGNQTGNQVGNRAPTANQQPDPNSGLLAFLDADGATHIRVSRFANDPALQRQAETREQYEQRLQDNEQLAKCGDVLKSFYEKANAKK